MGSQLAQPAAEKDLTSEEEDVKVDSDMGS